MPLQILSGQEKSLLQKTHVPIPTFMSDGSQLPAMLAARDLNPFFSHM